MLSYKVLTLHHLPFIGDYLDVSQVFWGCHVSVCLTLHMCYFLGALLDHGLYIPSNTWDAYKL